MKLCGDFYSGCLLEEIQLVLAEWRMVQVIQPVQVDRVTH